MGWLPAQREHEMLSGPPFIFAQVVKRQKSWVLERRLIGTHQVGRRAQRRVAELEAARSLAMELDLPGERWQIAAQLVEVYQSLGDRVRSTAALEDARVIIQSLEARIGDQRLRSTFFHAVPWATDTLS
jgi:hypothetical protein